MNDRKFDNTIKITVKTNLCKVDNVDHVQIITSVGEQVSRKIIELEDAAIREALIHLGWRPPFDIPDHIKDEVTDHRGKSPNGLHYEFTGTMAEHNAYVDGLWEKHWEFLKLNAS